MANRRGKSGSSDKNYYYFFLQGGSRIIADSDCSHEIKRRLLLRLKTMANLDSILIKQDITLPTKIHIVMCEKPCIVMVFPVVMCGCESWTIKKASTKELMLLNCGVGEDS